MKNIGKSFKESSAGIKFCLASCFSFGLLCLIGIADLDYGYYTFLRLFSFFALGITIIAYGIDIDVFLNPVTFIAGSLLILFNPVAPVYLDKDVWIVLDVISATLSFGLSIYIFVRNIVNNKTETK